MSPPLPPSGPEAEARMEIDAALEVAGWVVQNRRLCLFTGKDQRGFILQPGDPT